MGIETDDGAAVRYDLLAPHDAPDREGCAAHHHLSRSVHHEFVACLDTAPFGQIWFSIEILYEPGVKPHGKIFGGIGQIARDHVIGHRLEQMFCRLRYPVYIGEQAQGYRHPDNNRFGATCERSRYRGELHKAKQTPGELRAAQWRNIPQEGNEAKGCQTSHKSDQGPDGTRPERNQDKPGSKHRNGHLE